LLVEVYLRIDMGFASYWGGMSKKRKGLMVVYEEMNV